MPSGTNEVSDCNKGMFKGVIFDWDGTLANTIPVIVHSFQVVLKKFGCEVTDDFLIKKIGIGARNMFKEAFEAADLPFDEPTLDTLLDEKTNIHAELSSKVKLFEGAMDLLRSFPTEVRVALATMSNRKVINKQLQEKNVREYFDIVITADEIQKPKPNPEIFLECSRKLGIHPKVCVVVEDSVFGIIAAKKAGMKCIAVSTGAYSETALEKQRPDLIVGSLNEKRKILKFVLG